MPTKAKTAAPAETGDAVKNDSLMQKFLNESANPPLKADLVEGKIIAIDSNAMYVDIPPFGTGLIYGREFIIARDIIKKSHVGDSVTAKVVDPSGKDGYIELSLKEAKQALIWSEIEVAIAEKTALDLPVLEANKGGLILAWQGIQGFLPASQLKADHYPRVEDGDKERILEELRKLVGQRLIVTIIGATPKDGKLIFSEKGSENQEKTKAASTYNVGDVLNGEVTGAVDFGVFVKLDDNLEGLVHISEMDWALVENPKAKYKVGEKVKVKVIEIKDGKVSLSIKALKENPWTEAGKKFKKDMIVKGVVIKFNKHGALASIEEGVAGLVHVSEFGNSEDKLRTTLELGKVYDFKINVFDPKEQKMTLSYVAK
ncbi:MAG: hypothetical protein RLY57_719 [Candidatus Parcubacteria bacterium]|jgi:small subunit ribosomal protein S1